MTCREVAGFLGDYRAGDLEPDLRVRFEAHLALCPECVEYLRSYEATIRLAKGSFGQAGQPLAEQVPPRLVDAILRSLRKPARRGRGSRGR